MNHSNAPERLPVDFDPPPVNGAADVFGRAAEVWLRELPVFGKVMVAVWLPVELIKEWLIYSAGQQDNLMLNLRAETITESVIGSITAPAVIYAIVTRMGSARAAGLGEMLRWGLRRGAQVFRSRLWAGVATAVGLCLLVVPGLMAATWFALVVPVIAIEGDRRGVLARSRDLVRGRAWLVFRVGVLGALAVGLLATASGVVLAIWDTWWVSAASGFTGDLALAFLDVLFALVYLGLAGRQQTVAPAFAAPTTPVAPEPWPMTPLTVEPPPIAPVAPEPPPDPVA